MLATDPIAALVSTYPGSWVNLLFHWGGGFHPWSHVTLAVAFACLRSLPAHQLHLFVVCTGDPYLVHSQRKTRESLGGTEQIKGGQENGRIRISGLHSDPMLRLWGSICFLIPTPSD